MVDWMDDPSSASRHAAWFGDSGDFFRCQHGTVFDTPDTTCELCEDPSRVEDDPELKRGTPMARPRNNPYENPVSDWAAHSARTRKNPYEDPVEDWAAMQEERDEWFHKLSDEESATSQCDGCSNNARYILMRGDEEQERMCEVCLGLDEDSEPDAGGGGGGGEPDWDDAAKERRFERGNPGRAERALTAMGDSQCQFVRNHQRCQHLGVVYTKDSQGRRVWVCRHCKKFMDHALGRRNPHYYDDESKEDSAHAARLKEISDRVLRGEIGQHRPNPGPGSGAGGPFPQSTATARVVRFASGQMEIAGSMGDITIKDLHRYDRVNGMAAGRMRDLAKELQSSEPGMGWKLQLRGTQTMWQTVDPNDRTLDINIRSATKSR